MGFASDHLPGQLEGIASNLFTVTDKKGDELIGLCPAHEDSNPSFSFNFVKDVCHCFSCGFGGDLVKLWSHVNGYGDGKEGFKAFCEAFDISDETYLHGRTKKKSEPEPLNDLFQKFDSLPDFWLKKLENTRGWSPAALAFLQIRLETFYQGKKNLVPIKYPDRVAIPIFDTKGDVRNIRRYCPGTPKLRRNGTPLPKIMSWAEGYGDARLFPSAPRKDGVVLLCEGEPDTICAISNGFNAITQTGKPNKWPKDQLKQFKGRDVVIAYDADQAGQSFVKNSAGPSLIKVAKSVKVIEWPDCMGRRDDGLWPEDHGQDLTDFFVKHKKTANDLQVLIDSANVFEPEEMIDPMALEFFDRGVNGRLSFKPRLLADHIMEKYQLLSSPDTGLLYKWNGKYWEEFFDDHLKADAVKMLGKESKQAMVQDAVFQVKVLASIPHGRALNDQEDLVCLQNGMLNIKTLELGPHAPEHYASYQLGVVFNPDSSEKCDRWLEYLNQTIQTPEVIKQVQEFFGYCFYKRTDWAKCLLLLGPGSDGKSVMLNVLQEIIGRENCASISFNEMEDQFLRSSLYQKSVNICGEVGSKIIESTYFKAVTSGDMVNAAFKHKNTFEFKPYCKVLFSGNKMPRVKDTSDGLYRRLLPIQFKKQFLEGDPDTDPNLLDKLKEELSEIFMWALVGLHRLLDNKQFTKSEETDQIMMDYKRLNNPVLCFVEDKCVVDAGAWQAKEDIFKAYEGYCRDCNNRPYSRENFFRELSAACNTLKMVRRRVDKDRMRLVEGLRLAGLGE